MKALLLCVATIWLAGCAGKSQQSREAQNPAEADPGYSASGAEIIETGSDGLPRYTLRAESIHQDPASREITMQSIEMQMRDTRGAQWSLRAANGRMLEAADRLDLAGNVRITGNLGAAGQPVEIRSEQLDYDIAGEIARTASDVTISVSGRQLQARGLTASLRERRVRLESKVHGRFLP